MNINTNTITDSMLADKGKRFANYIIDVILIYILFFVAFALIGVIYFSNMSELETYSYIESSEFTLISYLVFFLIMFLYYFITEMALKGKSVGKLVTRTKVMNRDGSKPSVGDIALRSLCRFIPFDAISFLGTDGKGWHDSLSKTVVVDDKKYNELKYEDSIEAIGKE